MIDIHSHILWGMDDGAESLEISMSMASTASKEGIKTIIATPHCMEYEDPILFSQKVRDKCLLLQENLDKKEIPIDIIPGTEVYIDPFMPDKKGFENLVLGGTQYILVELPMNEIPLYVDDFIFHLQLKGLTPILAHPERNTRIIENPNILARLIDLGSLAQINTGSITGFFGSRVQKSARNILTHNMGHMLGTDAHSNDRRGPYMREAVKLLKNWLGEEKTKEITKTNPKCIIKNDDLILDNPLAYKKRK
ncbi:MAG: capsular biosynthesis protein, partial [Clostridiales bacterium]|nr:capsular biosynthesis protein [Clostridiales bacterium]